MTLTNMGCHRCEKCGEFIPDYVLHDCQKPELLEHLQVLRLEPGDKIILWTDRELKGSELEHLREALAQRFIGYECTVLMGGLRIGVIRQEAQANTPGPSLSLQVNTLKLALRHLIDAGNGGMLADWVIARDEAEELLR